MSVTGAILAGGPSAWHMAKLPAQQRYLAETSLTRQIERMRELCTEMIVVASDPKPLLHVVDQSVRIITDYYAGSGMLGGMHAALHLARQPYVWMTGSGMPNVSSRIAQKLSEQLTGSLDAVLPVIGGKAVPLHGLYGKSCAKAAARLLDGGEQRIDRFLKQIRWKGVHVDEWIAAEEQPFILESGNRDGLSVANQAIDQ